MSSDTDKQEFLKYLDDVAKRLSPKEQLMRLKITKEASDRGWHLAKIPKGELGEFSKILEEFAELVDAHERGLKPMEIWELCDMMGAIKAYIDKHYNLTLFDLIRQMRQLEQVKSAKAA